MRVNLGCGRDYREGWVNVDHPRAETRHDLSWDFEDPTSCPFHEDEVGEWEGSHVLEHLDNPLGFMAALYEASTPDAIAYFRLPYGSSDDAWEDPTHKRPYFMRSFGYFSQPFYWRADYGYRGDWLTELVTLVVEPAMAELEHDELVAALAHERNVIKEMHVRLRAVKPAREARPGLQEAPRVEFAR